MFERGWFELESNQKSCPEMFGMDLWKFDKHIGYILLPAEWFGVINSDNCDRDLSFIGIYGQFTPDYISSTALTMFAVLFVLLGINQDHQNKVYNFYHELSLKNEN